MLAACVKHELGKAKELPQHQSETAVIAAAAYDTFGEPAESFNIPEVIGSDCQGSPRGAQWDPPCHCPCPCP